MTDNKTLNSISSYGHTFQIKVLYLLLSDKDFLIRIANSVTSEYFESQAYKWIVDYISEYYHQYHTYPTMDVLKVQIKKEENEIRRIAVIEALKEIYNVNLEDSEFIKEEFTKFCLNQQLKTALFQSVELLASGDFEDIRRLIDKALKSGQDDNIGHEYEKDVETRHRESERKIVPTPWPQINDVLQGGLGGGDLGLIFGSPGGGKSWTLLDIGANAAALGYNVLHYTLELSEAYVGLRYDARFAKIDVSEITKHRPEVEKAIENIEGKILIKYFPAGRTSLATIEGHIRQQINAGFDPHLILLDYLDLLKGPRSRKDKVEELDDIYLNARGLAGEFNLPLWSPSQVNRDGSKDLVIEADKAAGSYSKIMVSDFCMSLSRNRKDKVNGTGRFHIMKSRYGGDGLTYNAKIDTKTGTIEIGSLYGEEEEEFDNKSTRTLGSTKIDGDSMDFLRKKFLKLNTKTEE